jgi:hypothetical protein
MKPEEEEIGVQHASRYAEIKQKVSRPGLKQLIARGPV